MGSPPVITTCFVSSRFACSSSISSPTSIRTTSLVSKEAKGVSQRLNEPSSSLQIHLRLHPDSRINREGIPASFPSPWMVPGTEKPVDGGTGKGLPCLSLVIGKRASPARVRILSIIRILVQGHQYRLR